MWVTGVVQCRICNHSYVASVSDPPGFDDLKCPNCDNLSCDAIVTDADGPGPEGPDDPLF